MNLANQIINGKYLTQAECLKIYRDASLATLDLVHEAYLIRRHYFGHKVKLNMILMQKVEFVLKIVAIVVNLER